LGSKKREDKSNPLPSIILIGIDDSAIRYDSINSRTSVTAPFTAAATTIAGLINSVRPLEDP
jgi:hypothetical protein